MKTCHHNPYGCATKKIKAVYLKHNHKKKKNFHLLYDYLKHSSSWLDSFRGCVMAPEAGEEQKERRVIFQGLSQSALAVEEGIRKCLLSLQLGQWVIVSLKVKLKRSR